MLLPGHKTGSASGMPHPRPLAHCPIIEALVDLRVAVGPAVTAEMFDDAVGLMAQRGFVRKGPIVEQTVTLGVGSDIPEPRASQQLVGTRFHSSDDLFVAQFTIHGFTVSRLRPYEAWSGLHRQAAGLWDLYRQIAVPSALTRVATRYINEIMLPASPSPILEDYLRAPPQLPADLSGPPTNFLQRFVVHDRETGAQVIVTQARQRPDIREHFPVLIDIDCFVEKTFDPDGTEALHLLEKLRDVKNRVFFGLLTERALELFQ